MMHQVCIEPGEWIRIRRGLAPTSKLRTWRLQEALWSGRGRTSHRRTRPGGMTAVLVCRYYFDRSVRTFDASRFRTHSTTSRYSGPTGRM